MVLVHDSTGSKNAVQAVGSSTSYGKRYTAMALLNITTGGEDDDGTAAGAPETLNDEQLADLQGKMEDVGADAKRFLQFMKVDRLADIPVSRLNFAYAQLETKARRR